MIYKLADNIISPLGTTSEDNLKAVLDGRSAISVHTDVFPSVEPFCASLFPKRHDFTTLCIDSISEALTHTTIDTSSSDVIFIISTTKGNNLRLWEPASQIATHFGNPNCPVVVSNACISGVCAQITALRLLDSGKYKTAIVTGCDIQTQFIVSGFQSLKALSSAPCRPFDKDRTGLNLGEAAATIVFSTEKPNLPAAWALLDGSIHNDANHISGPSRTGEGSFRCLSDVLRKTEINNIACVNVHGTATLYNDEMESIALSRAGLSETPVNALKGFYGHTMGAAGVLESILTMRSVEQGLILPTRGFYQQGTTNAVAIDNSLRHTKKRQFIKLLSGFGGCNAAIIYSLL